MKSLNVRRRRNEVSLGELDRPAFGVLLRGFRLRSGLSQEQLAERAQMSAIAISALERGVRRTPYRTTVALLAEALDLSRSDRSLLETAVDRPKRSPRNATHGFAATGVVRHNLPLALTAFLGREAQLTAIATLLENSRLVTITGSGGVGKTRTALQVGAMLLEAPGDGVWMIDLTPLGDANLVTAAIARALRIEERPERPLLNTLIETLSDRSLLLIFDNCEHVIEEAARVALVLLGHCPHLRILATSRDQLRVAGEHTYRLPSMDTPSAAQARALDAAIAAGYDAINLFCARARGADHRFALTDANAPAVAEICRRLDGIPLAIELAAARVTTLPAERIADNLDRRLHFLTGGNRDSPARHHTMRALIDWSFDLLTNDERLVFVRLSIFANGCTLPLATSLCSGDGIEEADVIALLASLVEKSLLIAELTDRAPRYRLLESFRAYGREKLRQSGIESLLSSRHATALLALAEDLAVAYGRATDTVWRAATEAEIDNWRAALEWTLILGCEVALGQRLLAALYPVWLELLPIEGRRWISIARGASNAQTERSVPSLLDFAESCCAARMQESPATLELAQRALNGFTGREAERLIVWAQFLCSRAMIMLGSISNGESMLREVLLIAQSIEATRLVGLCQRALAHARLSGGDIATARAHNSKAHAAFADIQDVRSIALIMKNYSMLEFVAGDLQSALDLSNDSLAILGTLEDVDLLPLLLTFKATYLTALGDYDEARLIAREALTLSKRRRQPWLVAIALSNLASITALSTDLNRGDFSTQISRAARTFGFVESIGDLSTSDSRTPFDEKIYDMTYAPLRAALSEADLRYLMTLGAQQTEDETVREALLL